jgi:hypothetical protein
MSSELLLTAFGHNLKLIATYIGIAPKDLPKKENLDIARQTIYRHSWIDPDSKHEQEPMRPNTEAAIVRFLERNGLPFTSHEFVSRRISSEELWPGLTPEYFSSFRTANEFMPLYFRHHPPPQSKRLKSRSPAQPGIDRCPMRVGCIYLSTVRFLADRAQLSRELPGVTGYEKHVADAKREADEDCSVKYVSRWDPWTCRCASLVREEICRLGLTSQPERFPTETQKILQKQKPR